MLPTASMQLRDIAGALRAKAEEGEFDCCKQFVQDDLASLPASLERIAGQMEAALGMLMPADRKSVV